MVVAAVGQRDGGAGFHQGFQVSGGLGGFGKHVLVVPEGNGLERFGNTVQFAFNGHAFNRERGISAQFALSQAGDVSNQASAGIVTERVVRGNEHIWATASSDIGAILVVDVIEGNLQDVDFVLGQVGLGLFQNLGQGNFFSRTGAVGVPEGHFGDLRGSATTTATGGQGE